MEAQKIDRIAVLVDCDNVPPEIVEHALRFAAQFGRVVVRRGYGCQEVLANKWQDTLVRLSFTPCLQYRYAAGKNTSDIALALDALEMLFDGRADTFCLVTSDSDFSYLSRKLRERGAMVCVVGEPKTPAALRNASDQFLEFVPTRNADLSVEGKVASTSDNGLAGGAAKGIARALKRRPKLVVEAVAMLTADTSEGKVDLAALGQYLKRTDSSFSPKSFGHSGLLDMVKTYDLLTAQMEPGGHWSVRLSKAALDAIEAQRVSTTDAEA
jgi:uncharacterized protein (TIGR00288 family)